MLSVLRDLAGAQLEILEELNETRLIKVDDLSFIELASPFINASQKFFAPAQQLQSGFEHLGSVAIGALGDQPGDERLAIGR